MTGYMFLFWLSYLCDRLKNSRKEGGLCFSFLLFLDKNKKVKVEGLESGDTFLRISIFY